MRWKRTELTDSSSLLKQLYGFILLLDQANFEKLLI
jgi:hypothetical protein